MSKRPRQEYDCFRESWIDEGFTEGFQRLDICTEEIANVEYLVVLVKNKFIIPLTGNIIMALPLELCGE